MPINTEFKLLDTDYVQKLEYIREILDDIASSLNSIANPTVEYTLEHLVDKVYLENYILAHPIQASTINVSGIDITSLNTSNLTKDCPIKAVGGRIESRKIPISSIVSTSSNGFVIAQNGNATVSTSNPIITTGLPPDELIYQKNGVIGAFPSSNDPDVAAIFQGINNIAVGMSFYFPSKTPPPGFLVENGQEVLKSEYPELYSVIGDSGGTPSSPSKFKLRDERGLFSVVYNSADGNRVSASPGGASGSSLGSVSNYATNTVPPHSHTVASGYVAVDDSKISPKYNVLLNGSVNVVTLSTRTEEFTVGNPSSESSGNSVRTSTEFRPKNICYVSIIRAKP